MAGKKGVVPPHIARMAAARAATAKHRPAGSVINPSRLRGRPRGYLSMKESSKIDAEDRLLVFINGDGQNIALTPLRVYLDHLDGNFDFAPRTHALIDDHGLVPHIMIDNELGCEPYSYLPVKNVNGSFKLRDKVGVIHYVTVDGTPIGQGDIEFALWQEAKVAWRLPPLQNESGV